MQILSSRWAVGFGSFTLSGALTTEILDAVLAASAQSFQVPARPDGEVKIAGPCGMYDPNGPATPLRFLDSDGNTWVGVGTRALSNTPNPALVEAAFRTRALEEFGENWASQKRKRLNGLRKSVKSTLATATPFRLSEAGALFISLANGEVILVGHSGAAVCKDIVGRNAALSRVAFTSPDKANANKLLSILRRQEESILPWPTGSAALFRRRKDQNESASVRMLSWAHASQDAVDLLHQNWKPKKIELQWGDERRGSLDLTGSLCSVRWSGPIRAEDPTSVVEARLGMLLDMNRQVTSLVADAGGTPLPMDTE
jgi:hypothetical protein